MLPVDLCIVRLPVLAQAVSKRVQNTRCEFRLDLEGCFVIFG
jgi:hypothetical protein